MSILEYEQQYKDQGYEFIIGIDEAGRGPLAGPVVACAVTLRTLDVHLASAFLGHPMSKFIRDSKTLSEKQREKLYDFICEHFYVGIGICDHKTIDRINILEATYVAMKKAITSLERGISNSPEFLISNKISNFKFQIPNKFQNSNFKIQNNNCLVLVDGNKVIPNLSMKQEAIIGGDKKVKSISAASIIAKVTRDRMMAEAHEKYPQYNFLRHKGYGTKEHLEMIRRHGACEIHRKSFKPFS